MSISGRAEMRAKGMMTEAMIGNDKKNGDRSVRINPIETRKLEVE